MVAGTVMHRRVAITGTRGRLGQALRSQFQSSGRDVLAWSRPDYDLDDPTAAARLLHRDLPDLIVHAAGWVDVDGCANDPTLAIRRNASAVDELARAAAAGSVDVVLISTNEVFDGRRTDNQGYKEADEPAPINAYGASKLAGERAAQAAFADIGSRLWILRTSWLFGPGGNDFPSKILAAVDRGVQPIRVVDDEFGCPTSTSDLASAIATSLDLLPPRLYHLAGTDGMSRFEWASSLLADLRPESEVVPISSSEFARTSSPPPWGVLDSSRAAALGVRLLPWKEAVSALPNGDAPRGRRP